MPLQKLTHIIEKYPNKPWNWEFISRNKNITMEDIEKYPDKPWFWKYGISKNRNITIDFIEKNIDKINFVWLSLNSFTYQNKLNKRKIGILALEKAKNRLPKDVNMHIVKHYF